MLGSISNAKIEASNYLVTLDGFSTVISCKVSVHIDMM